MGATRSEICVVACGDLFDGDGEVFASPMGLIPSLGGRLAKLTHSPDLLMSDGENVLLADVTALGADSGPIEGWIPYRQVFDVVAWGKRHVIMGASQLDRHGNQNISCIGDFRAPTRQLVGARGAPGNTVNNRTSYWISRHSPRVFVEQVDVVSGVGPSRAEQAGPGASTYNDIHRIVTNLAVLDLSGPGQTLHLVSVHPDVTEDEVRQASGCAIHADGDVPETRTPTPQELQIIRELLDPSGLRNREVASP